MLISHTVKDTILFPIIYVVVFFSCLFVLCVFNIIYTAGAGASLLPALSQDLIIGLVPNAAAAMFVCALFLTNFFLLIRLQRKPGLRFASFCLILICSILIFLIGFNFTDTYYTQAMLPDGGEIAESREMDVPEKLIPFEGHTLYFEQANDGRLENIISIKNSPAAPDIDFYRTGSLSVSGSSVVFNASAPVSARLSLNAQPPLSSIFRAQGVIAVLISHYEQLRATLHDVYNSNRTEFYFFSLTILFLMLSAGFFMRLSRWPLFNAFLYLFVLIMLFMFNNFVVYTMIPELEKFLGRNFFLDMLPGIIMLILAATFFLLDFVLAPRTYYKRKRFSV